MVGCDVRTYSSVSALPIVVYSRSSSESEGDDLEVYLVNFAHAATVKDFSVHGIPTCNQQDLEEEMKQVENLFSRSVDTNSVSGLNPQHVCEGSCLLPRCSLGYGSRLARGLQDLRKTLPCPQLANPLGHCLGTAQTLLSVFLAICSSLKPTPLSIISTLLGILRTQPVSLLQISRRRKRSHRQSVIHLHVFRQITSHPRPCRALSRSHSPPRHMRLPPLRPSR